MRSFWGALPTEGRWLLSTVAIQTLGRGLTLPFTIIYLHEVRGFDLALSGGLMSVIAITGLIVTGPGGTLIDRYGARAILLAGLTSMIAGCSLLAFATHPAVAAVALVLIGVNFGVSWPGFNALIASVVDGDLRQQYFGVNFALVNLGIGVGGIIGGFYIDVDRPETFTVIFLVDAASSLIPMALLLGPLRHVRTQADQSDLTDDERAAGGYREILRRPAVLWITLLTFIAMFIGYGQMEAGFPAFAREVAEVLDAGDRLRVRGQHRGDRAVAVHRAQPHQGAAAHPGDDRDGRRVGGVLADPRRRRTPARFARGSDRRARVHGRLRVRRDPAAADGAGDLQRPRIRPQSRTLQRDQLGGLPGRCDHRADRRRPAARQRPRRLVHRGDGARMRRHRRAGAGPGAPPSGECQRRDRARRTGRHGARDGVTSRAAATPRTARRSRRCPR